MPKKENYKFATDLINSVFLPKETLQDLFNKRLEELNISESSALKIMDIQLRTLKGILSGTIKQVDFTSLIKIANFLQISREMAINLYIETIEKNFSVETALSSEDVEFIKENFDLAALKKAGFISSISDYNSIAKSITSFFGLRRITDYERPKVEVAYSAGAVAPKNDLSRSFWISTAKSILEEINNPNLYDREALVKYFPQIRWHSMNVKLGLKNVINELYKIGITVIYVPPFPTLHLRGATFAVNDKPCIVLTDLRGYYPTLWFALVHELFHVLFDWDEIQNSQYHITDNDTEQLTVKEKEQEADNFAREYLFSKEKLDKIKPILSNTDAVKQYAENNHVHESFVYVFNAYDYGDLDRMAWSRATKKTPKAQDSVYPFKNQWEDKPILDYVKQIKSKIYH